MEFATLGAHCTVATCKIRGESRPFPSSPFAIELSQSTSIIRLCPAASG